MTDYERGFRAGIEAAADALLETMVDAEEDGCPDEAWRVGQALMSVRALAPEARTGGACAHPANARFVLSARQPLLLCNACGYEYWGIDEGHGKGWQPGRDGTGDARKGEP